MSTDVYRIQLAQTSELSDSTNQTGTSFLNESYSIEPSSGKESARKLPSNKLPMVKEYYTEEYTKVLNIFKESIQPTTTKPLT